MYGGDPHLQQYQQHRPPGPPLPPGPPPMHQYQQLPYPPAHHQPHGGNFPPRGPMQLPGPAQMMQLPGPPQAQYNHAQPPNAQPHPPNAENYAAKRARPRKAVDYTSTVVRYMQVRMFQRDSRDRNVLQPSPAAVIDMLPPVGYSDNPSTSFAAKHVHTSLNKNRYSINCVVWTPDGRRLITGSQSGEFTLWNGEAFNYELLLQAHDHPVRSMVWSYNEKYMVTGDDGGKIKYWQPNMNSMKCFPAHKESVRDLSFCPTDLKFCSCSDDTTVKVWDFVLCEEVHTLTGHGWDVKSVDWHPTKSLLASGGKDNLVKLWDAKSGTDLCSFDGHKNDVLCVKWNKNGNWILTASKDQIIKVYDIRAMKELQSFRGHSKDVTALAWHPFHEDYFVSGSFDGSMLHWLVGQEGPQLEVANAHDHSVWDLAWHPMGNLLTSGSNDHTTKFWSRDRPGQNLTTLEILLEPPASAEPGFSRNEGTIPGIGAAMHANPGPPLPPGPHPSLMPPNHFQQNPPPPMQHAQNMALPHPPFQAIRGNMNHQMMPPQGHFMAPRPIGGPQLFPQAGGFIRPPHNGQMQMMPPGPSPYGPGNLPMGAFNRMPPGPPPRGQGQQ